MADPSTPDEVTNEQRLEAENRELLRSAVIKDSMIQEFSAALSREQYKVAMLNGQLKLAHQPTE